VGRKEKYISKIPGPKPVRKERKRNIIKRALQINLQRVSEDRESKSHVSCFRNANIKFTHNFSSPKRGGGSESQGPTFTKLGLDYAERGRGGPRDKQKQGKNL